MAEAEVGSVLQGIPKYVRSIVVVDDGGNDFSYQVVKHINDSRIRLVRHTSNQGVGGAMLTGYAKAVELGAEIIVKIDADGQMDPRYIPDLLQPIFSGEADYTKGNRFAHQRELRRMPRLRKLGNLGLSFLTKLATGYWDVFDPTNGFTAIEASILPLLDVSRINRRYFFESSMLVELSLHSVVVKDVYIPASYGSEVSHLSALGALWEFPRKLCCSFLKRIWLKYFVQDFGIFAFSLIIGIIALVFGFSFGLYHWHKSAHFGTDTAVGTVMLAALPTILGIQFLLQAIILDVQKQPRSPKHLKLRWIRDFREAATKPSLQQNHSFGTIESRIVVGAEEIILAPLKDESDCCLNSSSAFEEQQE
jgi:glycosyltransferase involved in cell wall biosynthesis